MQDFLPDKSIRSLNLDDDFLFSKVMSDSNVCKKVLEKILGVSIREIVVPATQHTIDLTYDGRGIRLDVYVNDAEGTVYNVEMQRGRRRELPKRSRYYQGNIDLSIISSGEPYTALKKTFIIFICTFDPFCEGRHIYTFENTCRENPSLPLGDEATKIFLNTRGTQNDVDEEMLEFLNYVEHSTQAVADASRSPLIKEIHKKVTEVKNNKYLEVEFMTLYEKYREIREDGLEAGHAAGLEEGRSIGRTEGRTEGRTIATSIIRLHLKGFSDEQIADTLEISLEDVKTVISDLESA